MGAKQLWLPRTRSRLLCFRFCYLGLSRRDSRVRAHSCLGVSHVSGLRMKRKPWHCHPRAKQALRALVQGCIHALRATRSSSEGGVRRRSRPHVHSNRRFSTVEDSHSEPVSPAFLQAGLSLSDRLQLVLLELATLANFARALLSCLPSDAPGRSESDHQASPQCRGASPSSRPATPSRAHQCPSPQTEAPSGIQSDTVHTEPRHNADSDLR